MSKEAQCGFAIFAGIVWISFGAGGALAYATDVPPFGFYIAFIALGGIALVIAGHLMQAIKDKARHPE